MKKEVIVLLFLLLLVIPTISAVEFDIKNSYDKGETIIVKLSGSFTSQLSKENVIFYRGHVRVPINIYDLTRIAGDYYIYAQLPENSDNYTISIENVRYYQGSQISDKDIMKNFTITNNTASFSLNPGFVNTNGNFILNVQNLQDREIIISVNAKTNSGSSSDSLFADLFGGNLEDNLTKAINLKSGEKRRIEFEVTNIQNSTFKTIELSSAGLKYAVPVFIFANRTEIIDTTKNFRFDQAALNVSMSTNSSTNKILYIENTGNVAIENISILVSEEIKPYTTLSVSRIDKLKENSSAKIEIIFSSLDKEKQLEGYLKAKSGDIYAYSEVYLNIIQGFIPINGTDNNSNSKSCIFLGGTQCGSGFKCNQTEQLSKEGKCCVGLCEEDTSSGGIGKTLGWILLVVIVIFLIWFFFAKYKKAKKPVDLLKRAEIGNKSISS